MLKKITSLDTITVGIEAKDWEEAIIKASESLLKSDSIEQRYVDAMVDSVKKHGPYIVIAPNIALAHARPEDGVKKLGITFNTLKTPVEFGEADFDPVKMIVCLAAADSHSHVEALSGLSEILMDEELLEALFEAKTKEEFLDLISPKL